MKKVLIKDIKKIFDVADEGSYRLSPFSRARHEGEMFEYLADVEVDFELVDVEECSKGKVFAQNYCVDLSEYDDDELLQNLIFKKLQSILGVTVWVVDEAGNLLFPYLEDRKVVSEENGFRHVGGSNWERLATDEEMEEFAMYGE